MKHETELQKQKDDEAYKREQLKAKTALKIRLTQKRPEVKNNSYERRMANN